MLKNFSISFTTQAAIVMLAIMALLMFAQAARQNTTTDENPHIAAGYSYIVKREYRLNPEHPPLIKGLAAIPLAIAGVNFPDDSTAWTQDVNGQWRLGAEFLYESANNPDTMALLARIFPILITLALGVLLFLWTKKLFGKAASLTALTLFVFSPNFLAHGVLVTTDVGAAFAFFFSTYFILQYLKKQTKKNLGLAGIAFGLAQLVKFSLILTIPYFAALVVLWILFRDRPLELVSFQTIKKLNVYFLKLTLVGVIGLAVIYPAYQYAIADYSPQRQLRDTTAILTSHPNQNLARAVIWMADKPVLRAYSQFFLGHLMVFQRIEGGNTTYFLGDVSNKAWSYYFPVVFALKIPLALMALIALACIIVAKAGWRQMRIITRGKLSWHDKYKRFGRKLSEWGDEYFYFLVCGLFIVFYWTVSITSNLNIGFRHILPAMPFMYIILTGILHYWVHEKFTLTPLKAFDFFIHFIRRVKRRWTRASVVFILLLLYVLSSFSVYPHYLAFFTEAIGGASRGYKFIVDSNLDWGQELRALAEYVQKNDIKKIKLDYFGGGSPHYYLGERYEQLNPEDTRQRSGWIAVSATSLQNGRGKATKGFTRSTTHYLWLNAFTPVTVIGHSIFVYNIE